MLRLFGQTTLLNGILFLGSLGFLNFVLRPSLRHAAFLLSGDTESQATWLFTDNVVSGLFNALWLYPVYSISFVLNAIWYQEFADEAYAHYFPARTKPAVAIDTLISSEIYRLLFVLALLVQIAMCKSVPIVGDVLGFLTFSWLFAMYCQEYKWNQKAWSFERRIGELETHWLYYLGFGTPGALATFFFPTLISNGVFALIFPVFIVLSTGREPPIGGRSLCPKPLPLFRFVTRLADTMVWLARLCCCRQLKWKNT